MQIDLTILGGLPVTVEFSIERADPGVGIMSASIDEWSISHINGRQCKKAPYWLYRRIEKNWREVERIEVACYDAYQGCKARKLQRTGLRMNKLAALASWYMLVSVNARQSGSKAKSEWYFRESQRMRIEYAKQLTSQRK